MTKKRIVIIVGAIILIGLAILGLTAKNSTPTTQPVTTAIPVSSTPAAIPQKDLVYDKSHPYAIVYDPVYNLYTINILSPDFDQVRQQAEQDLLKRLNMTQSDACSKIKVSIGSPRFVNPNTPHYDTFSFCQK